MTTSGRNFIIIIKLCYRFDDIYETNVSIYSGQFLHCIQVIRRKTRPLPVLQHFRPNRARKRPILLIHMIEPKTRI